MISDIRRYITGLKAAMLACIAAMASCSSDDSVPSIVPDSGAACNMGLYIRVGNSVGGSGSRAVAEPPAGDPYLPGSGYEDYIHLTGDDPDVRVYLFTTDNKLIARVSDRQLSKVSSTVDYTTYKLSFKVNNYLGDKPDGSSFKVVLLANWRVYPMDLFAGVTTIGDLVTSAEAVHAYTPNAAAELTADDRIPMFGVTEYDNVTFIPDGETVHDDPVWLLRAYAKIEVYDAPDSRGKIAGVRLSRYNTKAYKAPLGVTHQDDYVKFGTDNDYVTLPSLPDGYADTWETDSKIDLPVRDADGHYVIYVPEYRNIGRDAAHRSTLEVTYADEYGDLVFTADFKYSHDAPSHADEPYDLLRNYWYKYSVKLNDADIDVDVRIEPYVSVPLNPDFGISDGKGHYIPIYNDDDNTMIYFDPVTGKYYQDDKVTEIENPFLNVDGNGRVIIRSGTVVLYYFSPVTGLYYAPDGVTLVDDPYAAGATDSDGYTRVVRTSDKKLLYYYNVRDNKFYAPDKTTPITADQRLDYLK